MVPDKYPDIHDFTNNVAASHVFSTLDLVKGYYQVEMLPDGIPKTAIITPFRLFKFIRMPFGLPNAGSSSSSHVPPHGSSSSASRTH